MAVIDLETDRAEILGRGGAPVYSPTGHLVYGHAGRSRSLGGAVLPGQPTNYEGDAFLSLPRMPTVRRVASDGTLIYVDNLRQSMRARLAGPRWEGNRIGGPASRRHSEHPAVSRRNSELALSAKGESYSGSMGLSQCRDLAVRSGAQTRESGNSRSPAYEYSACLVPRLETGSPFPRTRTEII